MKDLDPRYLAIFSALAELPSTQLCRIVSSPPGSIVCDQWAYEIDPGGKPGRY